MMRLHAQDNDNQKNCVVCKVSAFLLEVVTYPINN